MMTLLRSALFALIFYGGTLGAVILAFPYSWAGEEALRRHAHRWAMFHEWCAHHILGIVTRVEGVIPEGPHLYAAKHQSMYETVQLLLVVGDPAVVLKQELADIPLWGRAARQYGMIPVDREGSAGAMRRMMRAAAAAKAADRSVLIFPEGTRVAPGEQPALRPGVAGLYRILDLPVVPIALNSGRLWPRRSFLKKKGVVTMRVGEPIPPGLPRAEIEARVHAAINALEREGG